MFAKLKKKVRDEIGAKGAGENPPLAGIHGTGPGHARPDSTVSSPSSADVSKHFGSPSSVKSSSDDLDTGIPKIDDLDVTPYEENVMTAQRQLSDMSDMDLSGDGLISALETEIQEIQVMETKLEKSRDHVNQAESGSDENVSSLEKEISNLNMTIARQTAEIHALERKHREGYSQDELQKRAERAEQESEKIFQMKEQSLNEQKEHFESEIVNMKQIYNEKEKRFREKYSELEKRLAMVEKLYEAEKAASKKKIEKMLSEQDDWLQKEIDSERKINSLENEVESLKSDLGEKALGNKHMNSHLERKEKEWETLHKKLLQGESDSKTKDSKIEILQNSIKKLQLDYHNCVKEKDDLLIRNVQLSQDFDAFKRQKRTDQGSIERDVQQRDSAIAGLEQHIEQLQGELKVTQNRESDLATQHEAALAAIESEEVNKMRKIIKDLEDQVMDKGRTIKMQQSRLADLKKTLQRELKVQSLPNDDISETITNNSGYHADSSNVSRSTNSTSRTNNVPPTLTPSASVPMSLNSMSVLRTLEAVTPKHMAGPSPYSANAQFQISSIQSGSDHTMTFTSNSDDPFQDCRDVNFMYLKHVIMKFLLSQESESMKLIRAVSVLLHFSIDEQKLIKQTMEWKMSWFGTKPKLGKGQLAKIVPPPY